jgi:hypothetical protein
MSGEVGTSEGQRHERTVAPGSATLVSIQAAPHATCYLSHADVSEHRLQLDADEFGVVRFHASAPSDAAPLEVRLEEHREDGVRLAHTLVVSADEHHWDPARDAGIASQGETIPALVDDPRHLTNAELVSRGYPPRPGPGAAPARHERWRRLVSQDYTRVNSTKIEHPDVRFTMVEPDQVMSPTLPLPPPSEREV